MFTTQQKEDFYIKLYFNVKDGFEIGGLKRAYLDFNRTLKIKDNDQLQRDRKRNQTQQFLKKELLELISNNLKSQAEFDDYHKRLCLKLIDNWDELTIGQAQKWINMTLKYWLLFGDKRIKKIQDNANYFHIPIDGYVQKGMFNETNSKPWSKISTYNEYFDYQLRQRKKQTGNPPIIDELEFFNKF